jgi:hypothetical protein
MRLEAFGYKLIVTAEFWKPPSTAAENAKIEEEARVRREVTHVRRRYEVDFGDGLWLGDTRVFYHVWDRNDRENWLAPVDSRRFRTRWRAQAWARRLNALNRRWHFNKLFSEDCDRFYAELMGWVQ